MPDGKCLASSKTFCQDSCGGPTHPCLPHIHTKFSARVKKPQACLKTPYTWLDSRKSPRQPTWLRTSKSMFPFVLPDLYLRIGSGHSRFLSFRFVFPTSPFSIRDSLVSPPSYSPPFLPPFISPSLHSFISPSLHSFTSPSPTSPFLSFSFPPFLPVLQLTPDSANSSD